MWKKSENGDNEAAAMKLAHSLHVGGYKVKGF